jgi:hypothetical protein
LLAAVVVLPQAVTKQLAANRIATTTVWALLGRLGTSVPPTRRVSIDKTAPAAQTHRPQLNGAEIVDPRAGAPYGGLVGRPACYAARHAFGHALRPEAAPNCNTSR